MINTLVKHLLCLSSREQLEHLGKFHETSTVPEYASPLLRVCAQCESPGIHQYAELSLKEPKFVTDARQQLEDRVAESGNEPMLMSFDELKQLVRRDEHQHDDNDAEPVHNINDNVSPRGDANAFVNGVIELLSAEGSLLDIQRDEHNIDNTTTRRYLLFPLRSLVTILGRMLERGGLRKFPTGVLTRNTLGDVVFAQKVFAEVLVSLQFALEQDEKQLFMPALLPARFDNKNTKTLDADKYQFRGRRFSTSKDESLPPGLMPSILIRVS